jgi:hypothetical protein
LSTHTPGAGKKAKTTVGKIAASMPEGQRIRLRWGLPQGLHDLDQVTSLEFLLVTYSFDIYSFLLDTYSLDMYSLLLDIYIGAWHLLILA